MVMRRPHACGRRPDGQQALATPGVAWSRGEIAKWSSYAGVLDKWLRQVVASEIRKGAARMAVPARSPHQAASTKLRHFGENGGMRLTCPASQGCRTTHREVTVVRCRAEPGNTEPMLGGGCKDEQDPR